MDHYRRAGKGSEQDRGASWGPSLFTVVLAKPATCDVCLHVLRILEIYY